MRILLALRLVTQQQSQFAKVVREQGIKWSNAARNIPLPDNTVEVVYASHVFEHLDPTREVIGFLSEARRVLVSGGVLRLVVPDLRRRAQHYLETGNADEFIASLNMAMGRTRGFLAITRHLLVGFRDHCWMYDAPSLCRLLEGEGFDDARELQPGQTTIREPGTLDLRERENDSVYVEARLK
ncbi:MAG: methyltransferase domain-containing protein [Bryobacteraceae bacterium]|jgi:SAM-dependent methyltransferase